MKIEAGKYYKTAKGDKVGPAEVNKGGVHQWNIPHNGHFFAYTADGVSCLVGTSYKVFPEGDNIVSEWLEGEPTMKIKSQSDDAQLRLEAEKRGYKKVIITEDVYGWPVGTIAWMDPNNYTKGKAYNDDCSNWWTHTVGDNCEWLEGETEEMTTETQSVEQEGNYKPWYKMAPEERDALLSAHHEGKTIQWVTVTGEWVDDEEPFVYPSFKYRVKPEEPETEEKVFDNTYFSNSGAFFYTAPYSGTTKGKATVTYTGGKPTKMVWEADL